MENPPQGPRGGSAQLRPDRRAAEEGRRRVQPCHRRVLRQGDRGEGREGKSRLPRQGIALGGKALRQRAAAPRQAGEGPLHPHARFASAQHCRLRNAAAVSALLLAGAAAAQAPAISRVDLQECGVYESKVERREDDAQSASGRRTIVQDNRLVTETSRVPARVGVKFGCLVVLQGTPAGELATFRAVLRLPAEASREQLSGSQSYVIRESGYGG